MRALAFIILLTALVLPIVALAEPQTFTATHTYILGDDDSRNSARQKCLAEAKRKILEQVGVYLESKSELITSSQSTTSGNAKSPQTTNEERQQITEQINTLAAGVVRSEVIKEEFGEINGRYQMTLTLKAKVDPDDIQRQLAARRVDQGVRKQVTEQEQRLAQVEQELKGMMKELRAGAAPEPQKKDGGTPDLAAVRERANRGDAAAQINLGWLYASGRGVPQDYTQARQWFEKAAAQGDGGAQGSLGFLYQTGRGVPQDYTQARQWYEKAAAQGDRWGQSNLGLLYALGLGVPQDYATARQWFEKAAAQGDGGAQYILGLLYAKGRGVPQDYTQARQWWEKSAAQGFATAQNNLGYLYADGKGVPKDEIKGVEWIRKAAEQGDANGQDSLGEMYRDGRGVPQHNVRAYMWFNLAVEQYVRQGGKSTDSAQRRDAIAKQLTPAQIAEAQRLAQQCQAQQFKGC